MEVPMGIAPWVVGVAFAFTTGEAEDGGPLRFDAFPVPYAWSDANVPAGLALAEDAVRDAFGTWEGAGGTPIAFDTERTDDASVGAGAPNVVVFAEGWPYDPDLLALTSSWALEDGTIVGFDVEINGTQPWSTTGDAYAYDLHAAMAHEVGHALGLGHSEVPEAVMYATAPYRALDRRELSDDDIAGAEALYGNLPAADDASVGGVLGRLGCASGGGSPVSTAVVALAALALAGAARGATLRALPGWDELTVRSRAVVVGVVQEATCRPAPIGRGLVTSYRLAVDEAFAGDPDAEVVVELPGGTCGPDGLVHTVIGVPRWREGDRVVVFLPTEGPQPIAGVLTVRDDDTLDDALGRPDLPPDLGALAAVVRAATPPPIPRADPR